MAKNQATDQGMSFDVQRVLRWILDGMPGRAVTAFTEGPERQAAYLAEHAEQLATNRAMKAINRKINAFAKRADTLMLLRSVEASQKAGVWREAMTELYALRKEIWDGDWIEVRGEDVGTGRADQAVSVSADSEMERPASVPDVHKPRD